MPSTITPIYTAQTSTQPFDNDLSSIGTNSYDISYSDGNNYLAQLYAKKVLYKFYANTIFKQITNTEYEGQFKQGGSSIIIRQAPDITSNAYTKGLALTYESPARDSLTMSIDQAFYQAVAIDDVDKVQKDIDLMNMYVESARKSAAVTIDTNVLTYLATGCAAANKGATAGAISANINLGTETTTGYVAIDRTNALDKIVEMGQVLGESNLGEESRYIVIPEWYATRLKLSDIKAADFSGDSSGVIRTGLIGKINNTMIYVSNNLPGPSVNTTGSTYSVICGTQMASAFAMQLEKAEAVRAEGTFGDKWRSLYVYGRKVVRPEGMSTMYCRPA